MDTTVDSVLGLKDGVDVAADNDQFVVTFPFSRKLVGMMHDLKNAEFKPQFNAWFVPQRDASDVIDTIEALRKENAERTKAREEMNDLVQSAGRKFIEPGAELKVSDFIDKDRAYIGPVIAMNGHFAAQFTGKGDRDGAGFVTIHQLDQLQQVVFKGDDIAIRYDDKFRGTVGDARPVLERMNASLGVEDQGVLVNKNEENFEVKFRFNPALQKRIQRIDGASFDKSLDAWLVPAVHEEFLARAVSDMRREFSSEVEDKRRVEVAVSKKIDSALIRDAFTGHGTETSGMVLAVNDRFVAQHTGRNYVAIHRIDQLSEVPDLHSSVKVRYEKGKGAIIPPKEKSNSLSR